MSDTVALDNIFEAQQSAFYKKPMPSADERMDNLHRLEQGMLKYRTKLIAAANMDFGCRSEDETMLAEIIPSVEDIRYIRKNVKKWMKPSHRKTGILFKPAKAMVIYQPLGVVGIITPWNYPIYLSMGPLAGALGAGNRAIIRMSKNTPETAKTLQTMIREFFHEDHVALMTANEGSGSAFATKKWDHLFFTGSTSVGRQIMKAASSNLTPVTLELGGKSPAIISAKFPMKDAAERIAFGKIFNMGQTCVAPDYVLCPRAQVNEFVRLFKGSIEKMYPTMKNNPQYTSIINEQEYSRLQQMVVDAKSKGAQIISINPSNESFSFNLADGLPGGVDQNRGDIVNTAKNRAIQSVNTRKIPVTLLLNVTDQMLVMQDEVFGPLLSVIPYDKPEDAINFVNSRPRPLAIYYFDYDNTQVNYFLTHTHSGGVLVNDTLVHVPQDDLPFGGIGDSGMGQYHGYEGFLTFSKAKGVLIKHKFNSGKFVYPPYGSKIHQLLYKMFLG
ncbi:MAG: coniferyl aldehyde dehydrogenase [Desulfamplus sp.]|nr:coniferyl aldehyde dehydrogenase [Desulfamplus sp.]